MDILAEHGGDLEISGPEILPGVTFSPLPRRRPRSGPNPNDIAFDARMVVQKESHYPVIKQSPTALLSSLSESMMEPTPNDPDDRQKRVASLREITDELYRRGIDADGVIKDVIVPGMSMAAISRVFVPLVARDQLGEEWTRNAETEWAQIANALGLLMGGDIKFGLLNPTGVGDLLNLLMTDVRGRIQQWLLNLDSDAILSGITPEPDEYMVLPLAHEGEGSANTWIHDRFCQTYLDSWRTDSLFRDWAYVNCETVAPCSPAQMATRRIDADLLAREIARRATSDRLGDGHGFVIPSKYVQERLL
jgi:hypothetical protein